MAQSVKLFKSKAGASKQLALPNCEAKFLAAVCHFLQSSPVGAASGFRSGGVKTGGSAGHDKRLFEATSHNMVGGKHPSEDISTTYCVNHIQTELLERQGRDLGHLTTSRLKHDRTLSAKFEHYMVMKP